MLLLLLLLWLLVLLVIVLSEGDVGHAEADHANYYLEEEEGGALLANSFIMGSRRIRARR